MRCFNCRVQVSGFSICLGCTKVSGSELLVACFALVAVQTLRAAGRTEAKGRVSADRLDGI